MSTKLSKKKQLLARLWEMRPDFSALLAAGYSASALLAAIKKDYPEYAAIPVIENPYSCLLGDIKKKKRILDQSTFGPREDPEKNLCKTPMCVAGNLVNLVGAVGYEMANRYGFETAASLIHIKIRPDAPLPNFNAVPNEWTMAYIEARAEEEKAGLPAEAE